MVSSIMFETGDSPLIPDEKAIEAIHKKVTRDIDLIIGVVMEYT